MDRERLTITLKSGVVKQVDEVIDGVKIRNRSHAIEYLLSQVLSPKVTQAVILAGGQGVNMRPLTYEIPKALIPVAGKPVVEYILELLRDAGIREIVFAIGHLGEKIREKLGNGQVYGMNFNYSEESSELGSAGALLNSRKLIERKPFIVMNCDILTKTDLSEFILYHQEDKYVATMALTPTKEVGEFGTVLLRGERVLSFIPKTEKEGSQLINAGMYIFNPEIFDFIPKRGVSSLDKVLGILADKGKLAGFTFESEWFEVTTPENYERAIKWWGK